MTQPGCAAAPAPFLAKITDAPPQSRAWWLHCADGVRVRIGCFGTGPRGTVLCFPGRTEYIEKYGRVAEALTAAGFGVLAIDWRGQGLADRLLADTLLGHVDQFDDYQHDVAALTAFAGARQMPRPWYLLAHSMGGAIGLRALQRGLDVTAATFSAPMWGLTIPPALRGLARSLPALATGTGLGHLPVPFTDRGSYVLTASPDDNLLCSDPESFRWFRDQVRAHPDLALGAPTMCWLRESMREFTRIRRDPPPPLRCLIHLGGNERIVSPQAIHDLRARWPGATLMLHDGAEHEVLMERPELRAAILNQTARFFADAG